MNDKAFRGNGGKRIEEFQDCLIYLIELLDTRRKKFLGRNKLLVSTKSFCILIATCFRAENIAITTGFEPQTSA